MASLQALIEFNLFAPSELQNVLSSTKKNFFETFWDSSAPRFGEGNARGWSKWMSNTGNPRSGDRKIKAIGISSLVMDVYKPKKMSSEEEICVELPRNEAWWEIETTRSACSLLPTNRDVLTEEASDIDDPDRVVLYDDISGCLFKVDDEENQFMLVLLLLLVLGCPISEQEFIVTVRESLSQFGIIKLLKQGEFDSKTFLRVNIAYNGMLSTWKGFFIESTKIRFLTKSVVSYIRRTFDQSLLIFEKKYLSLLSTLWFQFEIMLYETITHDTCYLGDTKKSAKAVLSLGKELLRMTANRDNITLWSLFGQFEWFYGSQVESQRIFELAISLFVSGLEDIQNREESFLKFCRTYSELLMGIHPQKSMQADNRTALNVIYKSVDPSIQLRESIGKEFTAVDILRIRKQFQEKWTTVTTSSCRSYSSYAVELIMNWSLFEYITAGMTKFIETISLGLDVDISSEIKLVLHKYRLIILDYHIEKDKSCCTMFSKNLWHTLEDFPYDLSLIYLSIVTLQGGFSSLKIRKHFYSHLENSVSVNSWLGAILYETERLKRTKLLLLGSEDELKKEADVNDCRTVLACLPKSGIINRIRSTFTQAVDSRIGRHCVALWRWFLEFEVSYGDPKEGKRVFYQALQRCPWSKVLYMDALKYFPSDFEEIIDVMQEKEIRLCLPVEEMDILLEGPT